MTQRRSPKAILRDIAQITRMERGCVNPLGSSEKGRVYYSHTAYEDGRTCSKYLAAPLKPEVERLIAAYKKFRELVKEYEDTVIESTRAEYRGRSHSKRQAAEP